MNKRYLLPLLLAIGLGLSGCSQDKEPQKEIIRPVMYYQVSKGGQTQSKTFTGSAKAGTETKLSFKVSGTLRRLEVKVGQEVKKGALIATLDASDLQLQYGQTEAAVVNAKAQERNAKSSFERVRALYENGNTSVSNFEAAKAAYESAAAQLASAEKSKSLARSQLSYTRLSSPITGKVSMVDVEVNENIAAGQPVVMLSSEGDLEVNLGLPESFITEVKEQDQANISFSAIPEKTFTGTVSEVSFAIDRQTSTYPVTIKINGDPQEVRPGMAASVKFEVGERDTKNADKIIVPTAAVGEDGEGNFVFLVKKEEEHYTVNRQSVTVGQLTASGFEVLEGVQEGDLVATAGLQTLIEGMKVRLFEN